MLRYPVTLTPDKDDGGFVVTFVDIPEAITQGDTREDALAEAADALATAMDFYFEDKRPVPAPSKARRGQDLIELSASLSAKVLLLNEMLSQGVTPSELARRLHTRPQDVNRIMDISHVTKIDTIASALAALGKRLELSVASA
ncbi:Antitoxin HicB [Pandoraea capi]|uniref:Antitoxin HicB n=1 Tax=Pandoraea capi TaxID=2508286 RepID=A0ABY6W9C7_9BURK|nr:type II toxin-antitoxin system HicB family antitoxin [Pandoraea capi]VVE41533.1 Antitoxin HicB [Pandoraea capi]